MRIDKLWRSDDPIAWEIALRAYWWLVKPENLRLEREMETLSPDTIVRFGVNGWFEWLYHSYYPWKYTAPNRLATTRAFLKRHYEEDPSGLWSIKNKILIFDRGDIQLGLETAKKIGGLGVAGASGLLSLLFPLYFGTVDQFLVLALREVLPDNGTLKKMNPESLRVEDGVILIRLMRDKARENSERFNDPSWTPRMIDKVLWATREANVSGSCGSSA